MNKRKPKERETREFEGVKLPLVKVERHFLGSWVGGLTRITKGFIFVRCNKLAEMKFYHSRSRRSNLAGYHIGAFRGRTEMTPSKLSDLSLAFCERLIAEGDTWDSGWRPEKRKKRSNL